jgi:hypothetical protein
LPVKEVAAVLYVVVDPRSQIIGVDNAVVV